MTTTAPADALTIPRLVTTHDRVSVFRRCLEVLAEPGELRELAPLFADRATEHGATEGCVIAAAPLLVLADLMTPIGSPPGDDAAAEQVRDLAALTHAPVVAADTARFVLALRAPGPADVAALYRGTPAEPHLAALLVVAVPSLGEPGGLRLRLSGPGIASRRDLPVSGLPPEFWSARAEAVDFPTGFDVLLVAADGRLAGLPRTTRVEVLS